MKKLTLALVLVFAPGCVSQAVKEQVEVSAAAADGQDRLIRSAGVSAEELDAAQPKLRELLKNAVRALYDHRAGWHKANYAINDGPDPSTMDLQAPEVFR
jgi:hypothetical protein